MSATASISCENSFEPGTFPTDTKWSQARRRCIFALLPIFLLALTLAASAQATDEKETKLKAAFVLKFALYVEWPESAFGSPTNPIVFGVLGRDPFGQIMDATMQGQTIDRHPVIVKRARTAVELLDCHVVFVSAAERDKVKTLLPQLRGKPILTVSDMDGFTSAGGMIGLKKKQGVIRFDINRQAAESAGVKISSKLLQLGDVVR